VPSIGSTSEEPPTHLARATVARAFPIVCTIAPAGDAGVRATLQAWLDAIPVLERRPLSARTRARLVDSRAVCTELARVLDGAEEGEGRASERTMHLATACNRVQGMSSMFACPDGTFVELLVSAPWNLLDDDDPCDPRTVRGAGTALVAAAVRWSVARGCGGAVALQAANAGAVAFYERLGFRAMRAGDDPLALVPRGEDGWSSSILRVASGHPGPEERRTPWMLLEPSCARRTVVERVSVPAVG
jgi:hypothetical protein